MPAYTRTGDTGQTGISGGQRLPKNALRLQAIGELDELNSVLGVARSLAIEPKLDALLSRLQGLLFTAGADLALPLEHGARGERISAGHTQWLEQQADAAFKPLPELKHFILPGGTPLAASLHHARAVCRRAERSVVALAEKETLNAKLLPFLNRLSSLLFALARQANAEAQQTETEWKPQE